jgi:hypothetical protein
MRLGALRQIRYTRILGTAPGLPAAAFVTCRVLHGCAPVLSRCQFSTCPARRRYRRLDRRPAGGRRRTAHGRRRAGHRPEDREQGRRAAGAAGGCDAVVRGKEIAAAVGKDPRVVQVVLDDSNADAAGAARSAGGGAAQRLGLRQRRRRPQQHRSRRRTATIWRCCPADADASAAAIRARLAGNCGGVTPAVIINDSHGRAWRIGTVGVAIGCAGLPPIWNQRGLHDLFGYELVASEECIADELAGRRQPGHGAEQRRASRGRRPRLHIAARPRLRRRRRSSVRLPWMRFVRCKHPLNALRLTVTPTAV